MSVDQVMANPVAGWIVDCCGGSPVLVAVKVDYLRSAELHPIDAYLVYHLRVRCVVIPLPYERDNCASVPCGKTCEGLSCDVLDTCRPSRYIDFLIRHRIPFIAGPVVVPVERVACDESHVHDECAE